MAMWRVSATSLQHGFEALIDHGDVYTRKFTDGKRNKTMSDNGFTLFAGFYGKNECTMRDVSVLSRVLFWEAMNVHLLRTQDAGLGRVVNWNPVSLKTKTNLGEKYAISDRSGWYFWAIFLGECAWGESREEWYYWYMSSRSLGQWSGEGWRAEGTKFEPG